MNPSDPRFRWGSDGEPLSGLDPNAHYEIEVVRPGDNRHFELQGGEFVHVLTESGDDYEAELESLRLRVISMAQQKFDWLEEGLTAWARYGLQPITYQQNREFFESVNDHMNRGWDDED